MGVNAKTTKVDIKLFSELIELFRETPFDIPAFSFIDLDNKKVFIAHSNYKWIDTYINNKLNLIDPVNEFTKNMHSRDKNIESKETLILTFEDIHCRNKGSELRQARNSYSLNSGGISLFWHDSVLFSVGYWSSKPFDHPGVRDYFLEPNKQDLLEDIHDLMICIYKKNKKKIFSR